MTVQRLISNPGLSAITSLCEVLLCFIVLDKILQEGVTVKCRLGIRARSPGSSLLLWLLLSDHVPQFPDNLVFLTVGFITCNLLSFLLSSQSEQTAAV